MARVLILGATSSIARAVAQEFALHKSDLILAGRDREELEILAADLVVRHGVAVSTMFLDVQEFAAHQTVLRQCLKDTGEIPAGVVLCIGYLGDQEAAQRDAAEARRILDTNFTACVALLDVIAHEFEARRGGFICAISSVAGDRGRQSNYFYGAAKAGLSAYLAGLRNRLYHSGVSVTTIKPGFVDTAMTFGKPGLFLVASPEAVGRGIWKAVARHNDVVYVPWFWRLLMLVVRSIPETIFKRLRL